MDHPPPFYAKHVFMCINGADDPRCCAHKGSVALRDYMGKKIWDMGLGGYGKILVTRAGCMGRCLSGPSLVIYPDNVWYSPKTTDDIDEIISEHLIAGRLVPRLMMGETEIEIEDEPANAYPPEDTALR